MKTDVAVIGAGPAGAWTAYLLARRGARVALVDPSHPREKPCGGGVTGRALALVAQVLDEQLPMVHIRDARFVESATGESAAVSLGARSDRALAVASRTVFDGRLLSAASGAGAQIVRARALDISRDDADWHVSTSNGQAVIARTIVGADGANSLVRRRVARPFRRDQLSIATGFFVHGVTGNDILIELTADPPGYIWSFPRPDHLAIGLCVQADQAVTAGALRARTARWIAMTGVARGARLEPYSWPIPSLSPRDLETLPVAGPGWMLVGDAAGLVDPITREGIFFALQSAAFAADALTANPSTAARVYGDSVTCEISSELARAARFKSTFFRPRFIHLLIEALGRSDRVRRVMADLIAGTQPYEGLRWRLTKTLELGLAWKLLSGRNSRRAPEPRRSAVGR